MDKFLAVLIVVVGTMLLGSIGWGLKSLDCYWTWSGYANDTKVDLGGCKVKIGDKWLPEKVVREIQ